MVAEIVTVETPLGVVVVHLVAVEAAEAAADSEAEIAADLAEASISQAFQLDVTSVEIPARFPLNQTEASRFCAVIVSEEMIKEAEPPHLEAIDSMIEQTTDLDEHHQDLLLLAQVSSRRSRRSTESLTRFSPS